MEMWNNPACSKCAGARETLDAARVPYRLRPYLQEAPTAAELTEVLRRLGAAPWDICRLGEPAAAARGMTDWPRDDASAGRWIEAMAQEPALIQRPILLLDDGSAIVGRTPEALTEAVRRSGAATREAGFGYAVHHVQLAVPPGSEDDCRRFYVDLLGMTEVAKPTVLAARGGIWLRADRLELHLGVEADFRPARKAHPGIEVTDVAALADRLTAAGVDVRWDDSLPEYRRFHTADPFGNRLEFLQRA